MKLVDILARELKEWPEEFPHAHLSQSVSGRVAYVINNKERMSVGGFEKADDWLDALVDKKDWQEAREALSKPADFPSLAAKMCGIDMRESDASDNSEQPDWSEAPEGFDYFIRWPHKSMRGNFYKLVGNHYVRDNDYYARVSDVAGDPEIIVTKRPVSAEEPWNGEGLPPVGTVCESTWNESRDEWFKAKVFGVNEHGQPIFRWEEGPKKYEYQASPLSGFHGKPHFRPIRTPEQIAAEERLIAIQAMVDESGFDGETDNVWPSMEALYNAGYRKVNDGNQKA